MPILSNVAAVALLASRPSDPAAIEKLRTMLNDEDLWVRARAAESILSMGLADDKAQSILREEARDKGEPVSAEDVPSLLTAVKSENSNTRAGAMQALQGMHLYRSDIDAAAFQALKNDPSERVHTRAEVASIAPDPDHTYPLDVSARLETKSPNGTVVFTVVYAGKDRLDLLRVWSVRGGRYRLLREKNAEEGVWRLSADAFHFGSKVYLHLMALYSGTGSRHSDEFFRVESGGLTPISAPKDLPLKLAPGEDVWKGFDETFRDQDLSFAFFIWKPRRELRRACINQSSDTASKTPATTNAGHRTQKYLDDPGSPRS
jgi:HEAT repeat protein